VKPEPPGSGGGQKDTADGAGRGCAAPFALFRVDDRLLHGQVALAWGCRLAPRRFLLVDDALASDAGSSDLYVLSAPEGTEVEVRSEREILDDPACRERDPGGTFLLVRSLATAGRLLRSGIPGPVNLGGIHAHPGARRVLSYLYLQPAEEALLTELLDEGFALYAQEVPGGPREDPRRWSKAGSPSPPGPDGERRSG
jgi:mannose/fructose/N-acetylgalactosamine-specific phosphotransferase system component IIB